MWHLIRRILFTANVIMLLASFVLIIYAIMMLFIAPDDWIFNLLMLGGGIFSEIIFLLLYILRKSWFPHPGIDYK